MNKWILSACFLALAAVPVAAADVRLDSYRNPKNEAFRNFNQLYLDGVRSGLIAYNARIKSLGGQPAFCMPGNLAMTTEQTEDIMLKWRLLVDEGRKAGHTFSQPDLIIAATAIHHGLTVVTRDRSDYDKARVAVVNPWDV